MRRRAAPAPMGQKRHPGVGPRAGRIVAHVLVPGAIRQSSDRWPGCSRPRSSAPPQGWFLATGGYQRLNHPVGKAEQRASDDRAAQAWKQDGMSRANGGRLERLGHRGARGGPGAPARRSATRCRPPRWRWLSTAPPRRTAPMPAPARRRSAPAPHPATAGSPHGKTGSAPATAAAMHSRPVKADTAFPPCRRGRRRSAPARGDQPNLNHLPRFRHRRGIVLRALRRQGLTLNARNGLMKPKRIMPFRCHRRSSRRGLKEG